MCVSLLVLLGAHRHRGPHRLTALALLLGASALSLRLDLQQLAERRNQSQLDDRVEESVRGWVRGPVFRDPDRQQFVLQTEAAALWQTVYTEEGQTPPAIMPGQELQLSARLYRPIGLRAPGASDRRLQVMSRGADLLASGSSLGLATVDQRFTPWRWAQQAHDWALARIAESSGGQEARALVAALSTGERSGMSEEAAKGLRVLGVAHLLAVSGMHLAAVVGLVFFLVLRLWAWLPWRQRLEPQAVAAGCALLAACAFAALTGARPSTCRALLVASFLLTGLLFDLRIRLRHALAWSASILLLWRPTLLWDPGFQMSFAAALALALAFQPSEHEPLRLGAAGPWRRLWRAVHALVKASFWATLATAPIALHHFGEMSWLGLLSNLLAVPLTTFVLLPSALAGLFAEALVSGGGAVFLWIAIRIATWMLELSEWVYGWHGTVMSLPLSGLELSCWALICGFLLPWAQRVRRRRRVVVLILSACILLLSRGELLPWQGRASAELRVSFVEVGQGDATVIETPDGQVWLIDGGGLPFVSHGSPGKAQYLAESPARRSLLPFLRERRIDAIDLVIVSHPHPDHYVGLQAVARLMPIRELWSVHDTRPGPGPGLTPGLSSGPYQVWLDELQRGGTRVHAPRLGLSRQGGGVSLRVLWPRFHDEEGARAASDPILSVNDNSIVVRIDFAGRRLLFAGDIEAEAEELLVVSDPEALRADVVKVPHHGSKTSSSAPFVRATHARVAVISCGRANRFGFPNADVEARWRHETEAFFRTDQVGTLELRISASGRMHLRSAAPF